MSILEGLYFGSQVPFDEVSVNSPDYYEAGEKVAKLEEEILEQYPDIKMLLDEYNSAHIEHAALGTFHEFSIGFRVGAQLMLEMLKEL